MLKEQEQMAPSPGQTLSGQGVRRITRLRRDSIIKRIATWNVQSLYAAGKLQNLIQEMNRLKIDVLGVSEVRWTGVGMIQSSGKVFYYSCNMDPNHRGGVGILLDGKLQPSIKAVVPISDRVILIQLHGQPININIIQVYAPTADKSDEDLELFYQQIDKALKVTKSNEINILMGDFNAKVGRGRVENIVGSYGLGERNNRGDRLIEYCQDNELVITNTWYNLPPRRLYTWRSPQDTNHHIVRNQIDYIMINRRFRNSIEKTTALPGADVGSDHNPVCSTIQIKLAKIKKKPDKKVPNIKALEDPDVKLKYQEHINNEIAMISTEVDVEEHWSKIKGTLLAVNNTDLPRPKTLPKQQWMTNAILEMMEERRKCKVRGNNNEYRILQRKIRQEIRAAKEKWMSEMCAEAERFSHLGDSFHLHKKIKEIAGEHKQKAIMSIKDNRGELVTNKDELLSIWKSYSADLFNDNRSTIPPQMEENPIGPSILKSEVVHAIRLMKNGKAPGPDEMFSETLKLLNEESLDVVVSLFNNIYSTGVIPNDWLRSTFIPLPKKQNAHLCKDYRLISLMSHFLKLFLRVLHTRLYRRCEEVSGDSQFGFKSGFGTREAIFSLQMLIQNCLDQRKDVFICFIDYEKAFDNVRHDLLLRYLEDLGLDDKDVRIIRNLYWNQTAEVRLPCGSETEEFSIKKGVRQGCILSPMLFNLYVERAFQEALATSTLGIKVNGIPINNIRYADDTVILADTADDLQSLLNAVNDASNALGLKINAAKTKFMAISKSAMPNFRLTINGIDRIEQVRKFKYLGCYLNDRWDPEVEIKCRIEQARATFLRLRKLLVDHRLDIKLRLRMTKCYVWPVLLYGMETWTLKASSINKLEAFEMWTLRRILKISWVEKIRNEEVIRRAKLEDRELFETIKKRKIAYFGHIMRGERYELPRLILEGKIEGKRGIGRKKLSWLRNIRHWTGINDFGSLRDAANNRYI